MRLESVQCARAAGAVPLPCRVRVRPGRAGAPGARSRGGGAPLAVPPGRPASVAPVSASRVCGGAGGLAGGRVAQHRPHPSTVSYTCLCIFRFEN